MSVAVSLIFDGGARPAGGKMVIVQAAYTAEAYVITAGNLIDFSSVLPAWGVDWSQVKVTPLGTGSLGHGVVPVISATAGKVNVRLFTGVTEVVDTTATTESYKLLLTASQPRA